MVDLRKVALWQQTSLKGGCIRFEDELTKINENVNLGIQKI